MKCINMKMQFASQKMCVSRYKDRQEETLSALPEALADSVAILFLSILKQYKLELGMQ